MGSIQGNLWEKCVGWERKKEGERKKLKGNITTRKYVSKPKVCQNRTKLHLNKTVKSATAIALYAHCTCSYKVLGWQTAVGGDG